MKLKYFILFLLPVALLASDAAGGEGKTDIIPRVINFAIFASILYYLIAKPLKAYFVGRSNEIASRLSSIQDKLKESASVKEAAMDKLKNADASSVDIIDTAKKEVELMVAKIENTLKNDLENLHKSHEERLVIEEKKMTKNVVAEIVDEMFKGEKSQLANEDFLNIIKKKVA